jgi:hypothetical protein
VLFSGHGGHRGLAGFQEPHIAAIAGTGEQSQWVCAFWPPVEQQGPVFTCAVEGASRSHIWKPLQAQENKASRCVLSMELTVPLCAKKPHHRAWSGATGKLQGHMIGSADL